jgi:hypothetical protein
MIVGEGVAFHSRNCLKLFKNEFRKIAVWHKQYKTAIIMKHMDAWKDIFDETDIGEPYTIVQDRLLLYIFILFFIFLCGLLTLFFHVKRFSSYFFLYLIDSFHILTINIMSADLKELEATRHSPSEDQVDEEFVQAEDEQEYEDYDDYDDYLDDELNDTDMWDNATGGKKKKKKKRN